MKLRIVMFLLAVLVGLTILIYLANLFLQIRHPVTTSVMQPVTQKISLLPSPISTPICANLLFGGDLMFDRHIREKAQARGSYDFILIGVEDLLFRADGVVANLEGPVTDYPSRSVGSAVGSTDNYFLLSVLRQSVLCWRIGRFFSTWVIITCSISAKMV